jgi:hypothetical protein
MKHSFKGMNTLISLVGFLERIQISKVNRQRMQSDGNKSCIGSCIGESETKLSLVNLHIKNISPKKPQGQLFHQSAGITY